MLVFILLASVPQADEKERYFPATPSGIRVEAGYYRPDLDFLERKYVEACRCLGGCRMNFTVEIVTDDLCFECPSSSSGYCGGVTGFIWEKAFVFLTEKRWLKQTWDGKQFLPDPVDCGGLAGAWTLASDGRRLIAFGHQGRFHIPRPSVVAHSRYSPDAGAGISYMVCNGKRWESADRPVFRDFARQVLSAPVVPAAFWSDKVPLFFLERAQDSPRMKFALLKMADKH